MHTIGVFERAVSKNANRLLAFDRTRKLTYAEASEAARSMAQRLRNEDVQRGDPVALCSSDRVELLVAILGTWYVGALPSLVDARTVDADLPYFLGNIRPRVIIAEPTHHARLQSVIGSGTILDIEDSNPSAGTVVADHDEEADLYLSYTSGTTGEPKGAVLRSGPVALGTSCIADRLGLRRDDVLLATTPTSSSFQLVAALLPALHVGATIGFVAGSSTQEIWNAASASGATVLVAYPLTLSDVVNHSAARPDVFRLALSGGSPLAPRIKRDYRERLGIPLVESYGQSEFGGFMALGRPGDQEGEDGFVGTPLPDRLSLVAGPSNVELPTGEIGEVVVPAGYFKGYWNREEETERALAGGLLHCGDLGVSDDHGRLKVMGRTREAERAEARGVFLRELEDAYYEHPAVQHAVVVEDDANVIHAFAELRPEHTTSEEDLAQVTSEVCALKASSTHVLSRMPRTFSGKADRRTLSSSVDS